MSPEVLRATALHLLTTSTNASYGARQAVRDALTLEREVEAALIAETATQTMREPPRMMVAVDGVADEDDGA